MSKITFVTTEEEMKICYFSTIDTSFGKELRLFARFEVGYGTFGTWTSTDRTNAITQEDGRQHRNTTIMAIKLHKAVIVDLSEELDIVISIPRSAIWTFVEQLQVLNQLLEAATIQGNKYSLLGNNSSE